MLEEFKPGDVVTLKYRRANDERGTKVRLVSRRTDTFDGWNWANVADDYRGWDSSAQFVKTTEAREFVVDISDLRAGDVIVEANINGSITNHRVRREATVIPEPDFPDRVIALRAFNGGTVYAMHARTTGTWYRYIPAAEKGKNWSDFVQAYDVVGIKEEQ